MITTDDVLDALTKSAAYDASHTPKTSRILIEAWIEHFGRFAPAVQRADLLNAVTEYHREPHDRMLQPADLSTVARALRRDFLDRAPIDSPQRLALEARADAKAETRPRQKRNVADEHKQRLERVLQRFGPDDEKAADYLQRLAAAPNRVKCPWCNAQPGHPCRDPKTRQTLKRTKHHPSRIEAAQEAK